MSCALHDTEGTDGTSCAWFSYDYDMPDDIHLHLVQLAALLAKPQRGNLNEI